MTVPSIEFDPKISWGHIAQLLTLFVGIVTIAVSGTLAYGELKNRDDALRASIDLVVTQTQARSQANTALIESKGELIKAQLDGIKESIDYLRAELRVRSDRDGGPPK